LRNKLEDIEFADDVCLLTEKRNHTQRELQKLDAEGQKTGLKINLKKTRTLRNKNQQISQIKIGNVDIQEVQRVNYLGAVIERNRESKADVQPLGDIWKTNVVATDTKVKMYNRTIKSVLLYGAETWKVNKETTHKLQTFRITKEDTKDTLARQNNHRIVEQYKTRSNRNHSKTKEMELDWTYVKKGK
jgi:hypothetical protein